MLFPSVFIVLSSLFLVAQAAVLDARLSTKCFTTHTGYFQDGDKSFGLNSQHQVIFPANGAQFEVELQACPKLTKYGGWSYPYTYWGRLVAVQTKTIKANQCLTSTPSSTAGILYLKLEECGSDTEPPADQSWGYEDNDFGNELLFAGQCEEQSGYIANPTTGDPETTQGTHVMKMGCINVIGRGIGSFTLSGSWKS